MADDIVLASRRDLEAALASMAHTRRMVFFAGLPGVGKSLFIRELARVAHAAGRPVHTLQWDVARPPFEAHPAFARYPARDGISHAVVRVAVGQWAREAVARWRRSHDGTPDLLIGELPLIGNRLVELVQVQPDDAEPLLAGEEALFAVPVPSVELRAVIERARERTSANPTHPRESEDAPPDVLREIWQEVRALAVQLGAAAPVRDGNVPFEPSAYAAVYRHLLRHRHALALQVEAKLDAAASVYDHRFIATDIVPTDSEIAGSLARLESTRTTAEIEDQVSGWWRSI